MRGALGAWATAAMIAAALAGCSVDQAQVVDLRAATRVANPRFAAGTGPRVAIDEGHNNFHTVDGRYAPFAALLRNDGYRVSGLPKLSAEALQAVDVLVIANPVHSTNAQVWKAPIASAFTAEEIAMIRDFVERGGSLLLVLDHMPFAGAGHDLAKAFGFEFLDGFALPRRGDPRGRHLAFSRKNQGLIEHPILEGPSRRDRVEVQVSFTGSAFKAPAAAQPILRFTPQQNHQVLMPQTAWEFDDSTPKVDAAGLLQGATLELGRGRIAVFAEAGMFSAQVGYKGRRMGFDASQAPDNRQFVRNTLWWLTSR